MSAVESLGSATVICTDKTGTLTRNELRVDNVFWQSVSYPCKDWCNKTNAAEGKTLFLCAIRQAHSLDIGENSMPAAGDPLERVLVNYARQFDEILPKAHRLAEIPFEDSRRRQSVIVEIKNEIWLLIKGAPEVITGLCDSSVHDDGNIGLFEKIKPAVAKQAVRYAESGAKVLGYACRRIVEAELNALTSADGKVNFDQFVNPADLEKNLAFLGLVTLADPLRDEVPAAVDKCRSAGLRVIMITGDHPETARYVACRSGIFKSERARMVTGAELEHWNDTQLQLALSLDEIGFARVHAIQKLRIVRALQDKKEIVAVTGDGVNDAPALHGAHIGIAMGLCGTEVARESADVVLLDDNFASIVEGIREGRGIFRNIQNFMTYILSSNVPEAIPLVLYALLPIPLPMSIPQILAIDLGTDLVPAIGLGSEPARPFSRREAGKKNGRHILTSGLLLKAFLWLGTWQTAAAMSLFFSTLYVDGWRWGDPVEAGSLMARRASTAAFISVICMQAANVFVCRERRTLFAFKAPANKIILSGVVIEFLLIPVFIYVPFFRDMLGTAPVPPKLILPVLGFIFAFLICEKIRRAITKKICAPTSYESS